MCKEQQNNSTFRTHKSVYLQYKTHAIFTIKVVIAD